MLSSSYLMTDQKRVRQLVFVNRFYAPDLSATSQILTDLAEALADEGYKVSVFASRMSYDGKTTFAKRETINDVNVYRIWSTKFGRNTSTGRLIDYLTFYVSITIRLFFFLSKRDLVIVKTDPPVMSVPLGLVGRLRRAQIVNWLQDLFPEVAIQLGFGKSDDFIMNVLRKLRNQSLRRATKNIAIGTRMAEKVQEFDVPPAKISVIPNFVDDQSILRTEQHSPSLRKTWNLKNSDFVIGYSGNLGRAHDLDTILQTAERLQDSPQFVFLFIGAGFLHNRLQDEKKLRGLTNIRVMPYQPRSKLNESLSLPNMHWASLSPNLEGLIVPSKIYGIAAAGRPLLMIGDPHGEVGRILSNFPFGECISPGGFEQAEAFIRRTQSNPAEAKHMGRMAREFIDQRGSRKHAIALWKTLLEEINAAD